MDSEEGNGQEFKRFFMHWYSFWEWQANKMGHIQMSMWDDWRTAQNASSAYCKPTGVLDHFLAYFINALRHITFLNVTPAIRIQIWILTNRTYYNIHPPVSDALTFLCPLTDSHLLLSWFYWELVTNLHPVSFDANKDNSYNDIFIF